MIDKATIANPTTHYGSPRAATRHFMTQRITAAFNVLFTIFFVWFVVRLAGSGRADLVGLVRNPVVAIVLCLLIVNVCVHMRIGMNEVIEDYLEGPANHLARRANAVFAIAVAVATVLAVAKIVFWG
jgi:succinate dehydrogenase / fumarate reductase membrane anchor subunit